MRVKTLRPHSNGYGKTFKKKKGQEYEHPVAAGDIAAGLVEKVQENDDIKSDGLQGSRGTSVQAKKQHSKKRGEKNSQEGVGSNEDDRAETSPKGGDA